MSRGWKAFTPTAMMKAITDSDKKIFVVRRRNGKCNVGELMAVTGTGITLVNGSWSYEIQFNDGPPKQFYVIDPPILEINVKDRELNL